MGSNTNLCRLCMSSVDVRVNLFQCPVVTESYSQQISCMFQIELDLKNQWSTLACRSCVLVLDETRELRKKVLATQEALLLLESSDVKAEVPVDVKRWEWEEDEDRDYDFAAEPGPSSPKDATKDEVESEDEIKAIPIDTVFIPEDEFDSDEEEDGQKPVSLKVGRRSKRQKISVQEDSDLSTKKEILQKRKYIKREDKDVKVKAPKRERKIKEWKCESEEEVVDFESDGSDKDKDFVPEVDISDNEVEVYEAEENEDQKPETLKVTRGKAQSLNISVPEVADVSRALETKERKQLVNLNRKRKKSNYDSSEEDEDDGEWAEGLEEEEKGTSKKKRKSVLQCREEHAPLDKVMVEMCLLNCPICEAKEETFYGLHRHMQVVHKKTGYISCCDRKLGPKAAHDHIRYHLNKDAFKCDVCEKNFETGYSLKKHKDSHKPKNVHCEVCGKVLSSRSSLRTHLLMHKPESEREFKCSLCPRAYYRSAQLRSHTQSVHERDKVLFVCDVCGKGGYPTQASLNEHIKRHEDKQSVLCELCNKFFFNIRQHRQRVHQDNVKTPCGYCGKMYTKYNMGAHVKQFHLNPMLKCPYCPREFHQRLTYQNHLNVHLGIKFKCHFCPVESADSGNMYKHMNQNHPVEYAAYKAQKNGQRIRSGMK